MPLRLGLFHAGAAFQPRLSDYVYRATLIARLETRSHEVLITLNPDFKITGHESFAAPPGGSIRLPTLAVAADVRPA